MQVTLCAAPQLTAAASARRPELGEVHLILRPEQVVCMLVPPWMVSCRHQEPRAAAPGPQVPEAWLDRLRLQDEALTAALNRRDAEARLQLTPVESREQLRQ